MCPCPCLPVCCSKLGAGLRGGPPIVTFAATMTGDAREACVAVNEEEQTQDTGARGWRFWAKLFAPVVASIAGLCCLRLLGPDVVSQRQLSEWLRPLGQWAPIAFILFLGVRPVTLLPGQVFVAVAGLLFGTMMGTVYAMVGSFLAFGLTFALSKKLGTRLMKRMAGGKYHALKHAAKRHDFKFAALATINPLLPTDVFIAAGAASGARFWPTCVGVLLGTLPGTVLTVQFGSALGQGKTVMTIVSGAGMVVSLVLGVWLGRKIIKEVAAEPSRAPAPAPKLEQRTAVSIT